MNENATATPPRRDSFIWSTALYIFYGSEKILAFFAFWNKKPFILIDLTDDTLQSLYIPSSVLICWICGYASLLPVTSSPVSRRNVFKMCSACIKRRVEWGKTAFGLRFNWESGVFAKLTSNKIIITTFTGDFNTCGCKLHMQKLITFGIYTFPTTEEWLLWTNQVKLLYWARSNSIHSTTTRPTAAAPSIYPLFYTHLNIPN